MYLYGLGLRKGKYVESEKDGKESYVEEHIQSETVAIVMAAMDNIVTLSFLLFLFFTIYNSMSSLLIPMTVGDLVNERVLYIQ